MGIKEIHKLIDDSSITELSFNKAIENETEFFTNLIIVFSLAGISGFDITLGPSSLRLAEGALKKAEEQSKELNLDNFKRPYLKASIGLFNADEEDIFLLSDKPSKEFSNSFFINNLEKSIDIGLKIVEVHPGNLDEDILQEIFESILNLNKEILVSLNVNRLSRSNAHLVNRIKSLFDLFGEKLILQIDGATNIKEEDTYHNTIQTIATADIINKDLKMKEKRKYKKLPLLLSGDINRKTAALAKLCEISYNGISLGDHKSNHYLKFFDERIGANIAHKDLKVDLELVHSLKKELEHYKKL